MKRKFYTGLVERVRNHKGFCSLVIMLSKLTPLTVFAAFFITLFILLVTWNLKWIFFLIVPVVAFTVVTIMRNVMNSPRPFERFKYTPLVKHGRGKSFPSRHTASAVIIGMACLYVNIGYGIAMLIIAAIVAVTRILTGVHHIIDVLFGVLISVGFGLLGFALIAPFFGL